MYGTLIKPVLLYGSESWVVLEKDASLLRTFERKVLRTIFGPINENGVFRRRYNFELEAIYGKPDIISEIKRNRLRWFGHILRMKESRVTKALFIKKTSFRYQKRRETATYVGRECGDGPKQAECGKLDTAGS